MDTQRKRSPLIISSTILAVGLAIGGVGGASATALITGKQIKDGTVTTADIKNNSLKSADVQDGSLGAADFSAAAKAALKGAPGAPGKNGAAVAARIRSTAVTTASSTYFAECSCYVPGPSPMQVSGNSFTLGAAEVVTGAVMTVTLSSDRTCSQASPVQIELTIDGTPTSFTEFPPPLGNSGATTSTVSVPDAVMFETGTAGSHTVTVDAWSAVCQDSGAPITVVVSSLKVDLLKAG